MKKYYSLIDKIYQRENIRLAFRKVRRNGGSPGIDGETISDFEEKLDDNIELLHNELKTNKYKSSPVKRKEIHKPDGGVRFLGIPTVKDRVVQQAAVNILEPLFDPDFHPSSYGYRPGRSAAQAVAKAERFMNKWGLTEVVDMDLSKCFDTLDHEIILDTIAEKISDGKVLGLIREMLTSGVMIDGEVEETLVGSTQGGVISPLISNIYLNKFDQEMKSRSIRIVRYADDILIFARSKREAGNYKDIATKILEELKLKVNLEKTTLTNNLKGVNFLGFTIFEEHIAVQKKRLKRFKDKIRELTVRNNYQPLEQTVTKLNRVLRGWINYFKIAHIKSHVKSLMSWIRRRLRMIQMKQWKTWRKMHRLMRQRGIEPTVKMAVTKWKNSKVKIIHKLLPNAFFHEELKLFDMYKTEVGVLHLYYE